METDANLPDSGGQYYDTDDSGIMSVIERNANTAVGAVKSGDTGATIAGFTLASLFAWSIQRVITNG